MRKSLSLIIGLISLVIGLLLVTYQVSKIKAGIVTRAKVVRIDEEKEGDEWAYRPVLRFINYKNEPMVYKPSFQTGDNDWLTGETVRIFYTKENYDDISILSYWRTFWAAIIAFCVAFVTLLNAVGKYLARQFFKTLNYPNALT
jgi:uncharacterized protein DUF3592